MSDQSPPKTGNIDNLLARKITIKATESPQATPEPVISNDEMMAKVNKAIRDNEPNALELALLSSIIQHLKDIDWKLWEFYRKNK